MSLARLPSTMLMSYGNFSFPPDVETTSYRVLPMPDSSGRTVSFCEVEIGVRWRMEGASLGALSSTVERMVAQLMSPSAVLKYKSRGFGDDVINQGVLKDIMYGPKPGELQLKTHGGAVVECEWKVRFHIPVCDDAKFVLGSVREWCYSVSYGFDRLRNTQISVKGHVIISGNRRSEKDRRVIDNVDDVWPDVRPPLRLGFRRESENRDVSEDRLRLDYQTADTQLGRNQPGDGLLDAQATESVQSENIYAKFVRSLEATYTVAPGQNVSVAWQRFAATVRDRLDETKKQLPSAVILPLTFFASDPEVYGQALKVQMRTTWRVVPGGRLEDAVASALGRMGIWRPIPDSSGPDWFDFITSTDPSDSFGPLANGGIRFRVQDDKIIDLCGGPGPNTGGVASGIIGTIPPRGGIASGITEAFPQGVYPAPSPSASWLHFEATTHVSVDSGQTMSVTLPEAPLTPDGANGQTWDVSKGVMPTTSGGQIPGSGVRAVGQGSQRTSGVRFHQRREPVVHVWFSGRASRYGFSIPQPTIVSVGGMPATLVGTGSPDEGFVSGIVAEKEFPVVGARWRLHYIIPGLRSIGTLPNPTMGGAPG